jgi:DNA repair protein RadA/Sms
VLAGAGYDVLYISGEESAKQTKLRGERIGAGSERLLVYPETCLEEIANQCVLLKPFAVVVDSVQTIFSLQLEATPGTVSQLREVASRLIALAKKLDITIFLVGHVTKEGLLAGPKLLEHMVDTVLYFEGDSGHAFRILRATKNRFGSTNEIGVLEMRGDGLSDVRNPSELFLSERPLEVSGSVVVAPVEGTRPLLLELQALVTSSSLANPRRMTTGLDNNRVSLLVAILEKKVGLHLQGEDIFLNVAGGTRVDEPAVDLGVATAIVSSVKDQPVDPYTVVIGEVGLAGEVRAVPNVEARINEAFKLGFKRCIIPAKNRPGEGGERSFKAIPVDSVMEAFDALFY